MERVDAVVVGAGVVGLAVARALALAGREVIVLEAEPMIGTGTSSRSSEVIHAGLYYPPGSLKARLCVEGRQALYAFCRERDIPHRACGKLIVATSPAQSDRLEAIRARAEANGVTDLELIGPDRVRDLEPEVVCTAALWSPSSGIIDSHALMLAYRHEAERHGATVVPGSPLEAGEVTEDGFVLTVGGAEPCRVRASLLVNAAGLEAQAVAGRLRGLPPETVPRRWMAKGSYFSLAGRHPFSHLVYPVPEPGGLGVHATLDLGGQVRFGPDVEWVDHIDYRVEPARGDRFYAAVRRYWPGLPDGALQPGYAGIRPKVVGPGEPDADFVIQGPRGHGVPGLVNLYGIESPGLTASLAIGRMVAALLLEEDAAAGSQGDRAAASAVGA